MATHLTTWREIYGIFEAEYQALLSQAGSIRTVLVPFANRIERTPSRERETAARLQGRGGVVDEACSAFALTRRWPAMSQSLAPLVLLRLAAARDLAAFISQPEEEEPKDMQEMDCELVLRWALVEYWHMGGIWRSHYDKAPLAEETRNMAEPHNATSSTNLSIPS